MIECPYEPGDKVRFRPAAYYHSTDGFARALDIEVTGTVERIHEGHRWYRAVYETPQGEAYECFKF